MTPSARVIVASRPASRREATGLISPKALPSSVKSNLVEEVVRVGAEPRDRLRFELHRVAALERGHLAFGVAAQHLAVALSPSQESPLTV